MQVIPAVYSTIDRTVMVKDSYTTEETVPAVYKTVTKEVLQTKGGLTVGSASSRVRITTLRFR